jgi:hypothetical protein
VHCASREGGANSSLGRGTVVDIKNTIQSISISNAWQLVAYFKAGFLKVKHTIEGPLSFGQGASAILKWLQANKSTNFSERDAYQEVGRFRHDRADLAGSLAWLTEKNVIRPMLLEKTGGGRNPSPRWEVNPNLYLMHNAHNAQNAGMCLHE